MVKRHTSTEPETWLVHLHKLRGEPTSALSKAALAFYDATQAELREQGLGIATILLELGLDNDGLAAALLYPALAHHGITLDTIAEQFGESTAHLLRDVLQMRSLSKLQQAGQRATHQVENLRKMLLAMVADVRAVLVTLADRLWQLRQIKHFSKSEQQHIAQETLQLYAPLANRLGVGQVKWEMEDLCLRYLHPDSYKHIAERLASKRGEREQYIQRVISTLQQLIADAGIKNFAVSGRVKHIYSIYRKMQRKGASVDEIYDISAVRVLVENIEDCYGVIGLVHGTWQPIAKEFDDYITHPKPNGYRSIHTAVIGPEGHNLEVQVRTFEMHKTAELGVAAHWRYKEGGAQASGYEAKIAWLRQVMEWQKEISQNVSEDKKAVAAQDLFADRVYVFTPTGDIIDLPQGATPLDFAYHIHSEVGHRCRGAKVNGDIVPLTYQLQTGERVEILTAKRPAPSRDWLSAQSGYLKTPRARAKVQHWFKVQDFAQNLAAGEDMLDKELRHLGLTAAIDWKDIAEKLHCKDKDDMLAALGSGDIKLAQILHHIQPPASAPPVLPPVTSHAPAGKKASTDIQILGVGNLLTQMAQCCRPLPGDPIVGYITQGRGVSIHRADCNNIIHINEASKRRLIAVEWGEKIGDTYPVDLYVRAYDRHGLVHDLTALLAADKINLLGANVNTDKNAHEAHIYLTIETASLLQLQKVLERLLQVPNVIDVQRQHVARK